MFNVQRRGSTTPAAAAAAATVAAILHRSPHRQRHSAASSRRPIVDRQPHFHQHQHSAMPAPLLVLLTVLASTAVGRCCGDLAADMDDVKQHFCGSFLADTMAKECSGRYATYPPVWGGSQGSHGLGGGGGVIWRGHWGCMQLTNRLHLPVVDELFGNIMY